MHYLYLPDSPDRVFPERLGAFRQSCASACDQSRIPRHWIFSPVAEMRRIEDSIEDSIDLRIYEEVRILAIRNLKYPSYQKSMRSTSSKSSLKNPVKKFHNLPHFEIPLKGPIKFQILISPASSLQCRLPIET